MTGRTNTELVLDRYLAEGAERVADRVIDAALDEIDHTPQRRVMRAPWRSHEMPSFVKFALAGAAVVTVLVVGGLFLNRGPAPSVGTSPLASASVAPSAPAAPSEAPMAMPASGEKIPPGSYTTDQFAPSIALRLDDPGFAVEFLGPELLVLREFGYAHYIVITRPIEAIDPATGERIPLPADLADWLHEHPGLDTTAPEPVSLAGLTGLQVEGAPRLDANFDASGALALTASSAADEYIVFSDMRFRIAVLDGSSGPLIVSILTRADKFETFEPKAEALLATLTVGD